MNDFYVFDNLIEGVQVINHEMCYLYVNRAVAVQCRQNVEDLIGYKMLDKFPSLKNSEVYSKIELCMQSGNSYNMLNEFIHLDGTTGWFDLRLEAVDQGVMLFSFDITSEVLLKRELEEMNANVEAVIAERTHELEDRLKKEQDLNEFKTKFVSMASHQFRTPLTSIILSASLIEQYGQDIQKKELLASHFSRIKSSANNMVSILNNFLSYDQVESEKIKYNPEFVDFKIYLNQILDTISPLLKANQHFYVSVNPDPCFPSIDGHAVETILFNLLSNAIKYSSPGSSISIKTVLSEDQFYIEISDEGIGIPTNEQSELFGKFFRASNARDIQGSGLGLNIVRQFVELANGSIHYESFEGKGTTFKISIPQEHAQLNQCC